MTATTINGSAVPPSVEDLLPLARDIAIRLDRVPSCNELKQELRIGYDKAKPLQDLLARQAREYEEAQARVAVLEQSDLDEPEPERDAPKPQVIVVTEPPQTARPNAPVWPLALLALPAFVAIWSGWVGLGGLTGFGVVHPLPGIWDSARLNTAITLPIGMETYAAYALRVWLTPGLRTQVRKFAKRSCIAALLIGALGQIAFHVMTAAGITKAPWQVTTLVACLPVAVLGMGAALAHMLRTTD